MKSFSIQTKLYIFSVYIAGLLILLFHISRIDTSQTWLIVALCVLASLSLILKVEGATNRSHYSFNFLVYGFTFSVLGTSEAILVILVSNIVEWVWNRPPWFIQLFNTAGYIVVMQVASIAYMLVNPKMVLYTWQTVAALLASMVVFNLLNHLIVGIIIWLARGEDFKKSGIFDFFSIILDLALLVFGASLSFVWYYNPYATLLFTIPIYLIYSTLKVPALERKTEIDSKTGLYNHEYFIKQLISELNRANRFDRPMSIIMADLDLLRNINNTYGHLAGDRVLIDIAQTIKKSVREYDVVSRFGGEEFSILLPETTLEKAWERAEQIRLTVEKMEFTVATSVKPIRATLSLGISHRENFSQTQEQIMHNADLALYHSKLSGRNRCFAFSNNSFIDFIDNTSFAAHERPTVPLNRKPQVTPQEAPIHGETYRTVHAPRVEPLANTETQKPVQAHDQAETPVKGSKYNRLADLFISGLAVISFLSLAFITQWSPINLSPATFDWLGLVVLCGLIIISEGLSVDLFLKETSLSTSAIPILVSFVLFGVTGIFVASLVLAITLMVKYNSQLNRFIFNLSNHLLAGMLVLVLVILTGNTFLTLPPWYQLIVCMASALILYLVTTWMIAIGIGLTLNQPPRQIWKEQYSWLSPYYLGIGVITYALVFGYRYDHVTGLLLIVVPMVLLRISQLQYIDRTRDIVAELREKNLALKKNSEEINDLNEGLLLTLSEIIDLRDPYVLGHSKQVSYLGSEIAKALGLNEKQVDLIRKGGLLHDIGKLGISAEILIKPGKLTYEEFETIKSHPAIGGDLVKNSPSLRPLIPIIRHHHEFFNGEGYPDRLSDRQIPIEARIIAVADTIEAMISNRPYRHAEKISTVMQELIRCAGTQFDPLVVNAAIDILNTMTEPVKAEVSEPMPSTLDLNQSYKNSMVTN